MSTKQMVFMAKIWGAVFIASFVLYFAGVISAGWCVALAILAIIGFASAGFSGMGREQR